MKDNGSKRKKKNRGKSLIFKTFFKPSSSGDDPSSSTGGKALASDDNLVYCDVSGNCVDPGIKKSSSRGRMSRIFKAVLFDTAVKKKHDDNEPPEASIESVDSLRLPDEKIEKIQKVDKFEKIEKTDNATNENKSNVVKDSEVDHSSTDHSNQIPLPSKTAESPVSSSSGVSPNTTGSQTLTERKLNSVEKKPPLPSNPRPLTKPVSAAVNKPAAASNNPTADSSPLFILVGVLVLVVLVLWLRSGAVGSANTPIAGEEL